MHASGAAEAVSLFVLGPLDRVDLHATQRISPFELGAEDARRLEAGVLRRLKQEDRNLDASRGGFEPRAQVGIAGPAQCGRRNGNRGAITDASLSTEQRLNAAVRTASDDEAGRV